MVKLALKMLFYIIINDCILALCLYTFIYTYESYDTLTGSNYELSL
jgi:hypothetical protein